MTIDAATFAPTAALIAAGFFVYFHTSSFGTEYGPKVEKVRMVLLVRLLEERQPDVEERAKMPEENPYFPEAGYDEAVIKKVLESQKADDYQRCVRMIARGNSLLRRIAYRCLPAFGHDAQRPSQIGSAFFRAPAWSRSI